MDFKPRPKQQEVLEYASGLMGVSSVPGSGKTRTLSALAARLIAQLTIDDDQEVLIVTLVNSAVGHFARQIGDFIQQRGLLPNYGYRVRTLHGIANDIVRERPKLVNLADDFKIVDERETSDILQAAATAWIHANPTAGDAFFNPELNEGQYRRVTEQDWPNEVTQIASNFIQQAKDLQQTPDDVLYGLDRFNMPLALAEMCHAIYVSYQHSLAYRGGVDFQDLIRLALLALKQDEDYLKRLQSRWPYILEDEAQDSSKLQENILSMLAGENGNWVRVGDPNQSIYETFTTAKPQYLRNFSAQPNVLSCELPNSGRSTLSIIKLANYLIDWVKTGHPIEAIAENPPLQPPKIAPTPRGDPQPNPKDNPAGIVFVENEFTDLQEVAYVVKDVREWLQTNPNKTTAILVPRNDRGAQIVKALKVQDVEVIELLRSTSSTRETAGALVFVLDALSRPNTPQSLAMAYKVWRRDDREESEANTRLEHVTRALRRCQQVEDYLWSRADNDWLDSQDVIELGDSYEGIIDHLKDFRSVMRRWQAAVVLPIDQLILTIAQDLFDTAADLAIAHSLAVHLRRDGGLNPSMRLPDFVSELTAVAQNKRRVAQIDEDAMSFDPDRHKGKVCVATMHRAKGLEWDRVYLMALNNYSFPSAEPQDSFISEKWFTRDRLNLQAEALAQLKALSDPLPYPYEIGVASQEARTEYAAERLRLLYVGITRARTELILTWNTGRKGDSHQATPVFALQTFWNGQGK